MDLEDPRMHQLTKYTRFVKGLLCGARSGVWLCILLFQAAPLPPFVSHHAASPHSLCALSWSRRWAREVVRIGVDEIMGVDGFENACFNACNLILAQLGDRSVEIGISELSALPPGHVGSGAPKPLYSFGQ